MVPAAFLAQEYLRGVEPSGVTISMSSSPGLNMVKKGWQLVLLIHAFLSALDAVHTSPSFISGWLSLGTSPFQFHLYIALICLDCSSCIKSFDSVLVSIPSVHSSFPSFLH